MRWRRAGTPDLTEFVAASIADPMHGLSPLTCRECGVTFRAEKFRATCSPQCATLRRRRTDRESKREMSRENQERQNQLRRDRRAADPSKFKAYDRKKILSQRKHKVCTMCGVSIVDRQRLVKYCSIECRKEAESQRKRAPKSLSDEDLSALAAIAIANRPEAPSAPPIYRVECHCGYWFDTTSKRRKLCDRCRKIKKAESLQRSSQRAVERRNAARKRCLCPQCGDEFEQINGRKIYCSADCRRTAIAKSQDRQCVVCGELFTGKSNATTCSPECRAEDKRRKARRGWVPEQRLCHCGTVFIQNHTNQIHCSESCKNQHKRELERQRNQRSS